jgi:hypothetical protein
MANKKILLKSTGGDALYPRTSIDNLVDAVGSTVSVSVPVLDSNGKLDASYLPSYVDDIIDLKAITGTAPSTCAVGDMYYNSTSGNLKIYTATAANTWGTTGATPEVGKIYVNLADSKIYRWSGSAMVEISKQVSTVTSVRATSSALDTVVPTEKAVATALAGKAASSHTHTIANVSGLQDALDAKQGTLTAGTNISISNGTVSNTYSYSLPTASSSTKGGVKVGSGLSISSDVLSVNTGSASAKGILQVDETASNGIKIAVNSGTISAVAVLGTTASAGPVRLATTTEATTGTSEEVAVTPKGLKTELDKKAASSHSHSIANVSGLQSALDGKQGTLTAGTGISISSGTVSCTYAYSLPTASASVLGGVKIGTNISISSGVISVANGSTSAKGVVQLATVAEATAGTLETKAVTPKGLKTELDKKANTSHTHAISDVTDLQDALDGKAATSHSHEIADVTGLQTALDGKQGTLTAGTNISISNGTISNTYSYSLPAATTSARGGVVVSTTASNGVALAISSGTVSVAATAASTTAVGTVRLATTSEATTGTSEALAVTPKGLKTELDKKANTSHTHNYQAVLTAGNGITISSNVIAADISTTASNGVALAWDGTTDNAKKIKVTATAATASARGTVILASTTEATTGTDTAKAVTCAGVKAALDNRLASYITYEELT